MDQVKAAKAWCLSLRAHALERKQYETIYKAKGGGSDYGITCDSEMEEISE